MATYTNIATGQVLTQDEFSALVCNTIYTCCDQSDNVWFTNNEARNEYQWQQYFEANNLCSDGNTPVNIVPPSISGTLVVGNVLSGTNGTWTSDSAITYTYQWFRGLSPIVGATSINYTIVALDMDENIRLRVTATDSDGSTNASSNTLLIPLFWISGGSDVWGTATINVYA
jgi:hypothetical protein